MNKLGKGHENVIEKLSFIFSEKLGKCCEINKNLRNCRLGKCRLRIYLVAMMSVEMMSC